MLMGMKLLAIGLLALIGFYTLVFVFFTSLLCGRGVAAAIIFYGGILAGLFGLAGLIGHALGL